MQRIRLQSRGIVCRIILDERVADQRLRDAREGPSVDSIGHHRLE